MPTSPPAAPLAPPADPTPQVGASNWRSGVLRQAERLTDELEALAPEDLDAASGVLVSQARQHVAAARKIAQHAPRSWETLRNWWTGNGVETAWNHLQTAREDLLAIAPAAAVRAQLPSLLRRLASASPDPAHDPQVERIRTIMTGGGELSTDERAIIRAAHEHVRIVEDDHSAARGFRNNLLLWTAGLTIGSIVLATIAAHGFRYLVIGALAGTITTALTWRSLTQLSGPFAVNTAQALLKIAAGSAAALLGVTLVESGIISGLHVDASTAAGYAVLFGLSQQALTQVVDNAAAKIGS